MKKLKEIPKVKDSISIILTPVSTDKNKTEKSNDKKPS